MIVTGEAVPGGTALNETVLGDTAPGPFHNFADPLRFINN